MGVVLSLSNCKSSDDFDVYTDNFFWNLGNANSDFIDLLLSKGKVFIQDATGVEKFSAIFGANRGFKSNVAVLLCTTERVRNFFIDHCFKYATTAASAGQLSQAICNIIVGNPAEGQRLFSTPETAAAIINAMNKYATTPESVTLLSFAIAKITDGNPQVQRLFTTTETANVLINAMNRFAATADTAHVEDLASAIGNIIHNNPQAQHLFSTDVAISTFVKALGNHCTSPDAVDNLSIVIGNIASNNGDAKRLFSTPETASAIINCCKFIPTASSVDSLCYAVRRIITDNEEGTDLFANTPNFLRAFKKLKKYTASERAEENFDQCLKLLLSARVVTSSDECTQPLNTNDNYNNNNFTTKHHPLPPASSPKSKSYGDEVFVLCPWF